MRRAPARVLDLGCGEGWLARALAARGAQVLGIDASATLVDAARRAAGGPRYEVLSYEALAHRPHEVHAAPDHRADAAAPVAAGFDLVVANFALLGEALEPLFVAIAEHLLKPAGALIVQTVHPRSVPAPHVDGWRTETFSGFGDADSWVPMPWYFRTTAGWTALLQRCGFARVGIDEPLNPITALPASLILTAQRR